MAELADALDLGSNAQKACRFKSCSRHQSLSSVTADFLLAQRRKKRDRFIGPFCIAWNT
jgi:hypothetical protein